MSDNIDRRADQASRLKRDEAFTLVMEEVRDRQIGVFTKPSSTIEEIEKAHSIVCALNEIHGHLNRMINDKKAMDRRES